MTDDDWTYHREHFDSASDRELANSPEELDAIDVYRRLLSDGAFRTALLEFVAVGPGGQAIQAEIERLYLEEIQAPA